MLQVRVLFSKGAFISIFASDPHIIIKAINQNLNSVLRDSNINGHDYMRNIVHLPVFLNSRGLSSARKVSTAASTNGDAANADGNHGDRAQEQYEIGQQVSHTHTHTRTPVSSMCPPCVPRLARGAGQEVVPAQPGRAEQVWQQDGPEPPGEFLLSTLRAIASV